MERNRKGQKPFQEIRCIKNSSCWQKTFEEMDGWFQEHHTHMY